MLIYKRKAILTIKQKFCSFQSFAVLVGGQVMMYQRLPHVLIPTFFQPSHNCAIGTVKKLSEIFWRTIRALANDLHQLTHNFKSPALLQRFAWGIADNVPLVLKPLAQGPIRIVYSAFANSCPLQTDPFLFPLIHSHNALLSSNKF